MHTTIGEKIKALRKELNMTQTELSGNEMTKSMLSQIENNQAFPSMKNLKYLADRLGKPLSYFLDQENNIPLKEIYSELKICRDLIDHMEYNEAYDKLLLIEETYTLPKDSKIYADFLFTLGKCLDSLDRHDEGEEKLKCAVEIYESNNQFIEAARVYIEFCNKYMVVFDYDKALSIIDNAGEIYKKSMVKDYSLEIEILYIKSLIYSATGDFELSIGFLDEALNLSKDTGIYYKTDELYRIKAVIYKMNNDDKSFLYNINKAQQFASFTDNKINLGKIAINLSLYYFDQGDIAKAEEYIAIYEECIGKIRNSYYIQKAKIHYAKGEYEKALEYIDKEDFNSAIFHRFDYLFLWSGKVYRGLILTKLGKITQGINEINEAIEKLGQYGKNKYLSFAYKSLSEIYSSNGYYKEAYDYLKKSME